MPSNTIASCAKLVVSYDEATTLHGLWVTPPENRIFFWSMMEKKGEPRGGSTSMGRIDRGLLIAGPLGLSRPTARYPTCLCIALCVRRGGVLTSRGGTTRKTRPRTSTHAHERPHVRPIDAPYVRPPVRASSLARPPVRPSARPPARPPARPSARVWEVRQVPDLAGFVATIIVVVPVVVVTHIVAVIGSGGGMMECRASVCRVVTWCGAWNERWCHETPITSPHAPV